MADEDLRTLERSAALAGDPETIRKALAAGERHARLDSLDKRRLQACRRVEAEIEALQVKRKQILLHTTEDCRAGKHVTRVTVTGHKGHVIYSCELCNWSAEGWD